MKKTNDKIIKAQARLEEYSTKGINWHRMYFILVLSFIIALIVVAYCFMKIGFWEGYLEGAQQVECLTSSPEALTPASNSESGSGSALRPLTEFCLWDESRDNMDRIGDVGEVGALQYMPLTWVWLSEKYDFEGSICSREDQIELFEIAVEGGDGGLWTCYRKFKGRK